MFENIRLSFKGIWSHKMRSFLTMLGIIIGIAAIIAIVSTIKGTNEQIKENLIGSGQNTVSIQLYQGDYPYDMSYSELPAGVPVIGQEELEEIRQADRVKNASVYLSRQDYDGVYYLENSLSGGYVMGIDQNYLATCGYILREGRGFDTSDYENYHKVALLDENSSEALFQGEDAVGKTIEIQGEPYLVVGIIVAQKTFEPVINSIDDYYTYAEDSSGKVYIPDTTWPIIYQYDEPQNLIVKVESTDDMTVVGKECAGILNDHLSVSDDTIQYKAEDLLEQAKQIQELSASTNTMLIWIAGISLLVGGIGVMNIMLVSVTERTREIGIRKSLGARTGSILLQFLSESAIITLLGGLIGILIGVAGAFGICSLIGFTAKVSVGTVLGASMFSSAVGIFFGIYPAKKAAKLSPIEALRHE